jgi:hypothetical protein
MRRRAWLDALGLLLMTGAAWLVWDAERDGHFRLARDLQEAVPGDDPAGRAFGLVPVVTAAAFAVAAVLVLVLARAPRAARASVRAAALLVVVGVAGYTWNWVRWLPTADAGAPDGAGSWEIVTAYLWPVTGVACLAALAAGIAVSLLRRGAAAAAGAAGGAAVVLGAVVAGLLLRDPGRRQEVTALSMAMFLDDTNAPLLVGVAGLVVAAAALVVTAWCAGPPADGATVLARCRGGFAAVALLVLEAAARDASLIGADAETGLGPGGTWLVLHIVLLTGLAVAAAGASLWCRATPVLAVVAAALGGAVAAANLVRSADPIWDALYGPPPWGAAVVVPVVLAVVVRWASRRSAPAAGPAAGPADEGAPEVAPVG